MRVVIFLSEAVPEFSVRPEQIAELARRHPKHLFEACASEAQFLSLLTEAEVAVVWSFDVGWYAKAPKLRLVATPSAGRERVALDPQGRVQCAFGTFHGELMGESLLAMMLFMNRRLGRALAAQRLHVWDRDLFVETRRLAGQIALLVGYGAIAKHAAKKLRALGMIVHGVKRDLKRGTEGLDQVFSADELPFAVEHADHIACILPGDEQTNNLLDAAIFARMKPTAYVYNLGRGNAIDSAALENALVAGKIAGAYLDVVPTEPLAPDSPLWEVPNLYITPHASAIYAEYLDLYFAELSELLTRC